MPSQQLKAVCEEIIEEGLDILDLSVGIVSHISQETYLIVAVRSEGDVFSAGESFPLQDTYCREVMEKGGTVALTQLAGKPGLCKHPLYSGLPLESYISAPIYYQDEIWGTLNFSSMKVRGEAFSPEEIELVEDRAKQIAGAISGNEF